MVDSINDLEEGFYLKDKRISSQIIHLCYVQKKDGKWFAYTPGGGRDLEEFEQEIGSHTLAVDPIFLEGPINPEDYLKEHSDNLKKFINSKLEQLTKKPEIPNPVKWLKLSLFPMGKQY